MTKSRIRKIFLQFRGLSWAARELKVNKGTLSRFLNEYRPGERIDLAKLVTLAARLEETKGRAIHDVDGPSVKSQIAKIRRKGKK